MKKFLFSISLLHMIITSPQLVFADVDIQLHRMNTFLEKIKSGDVDNLSLIVMDPLLSRLENLLHDNKEYRKMLMDRYQDARFEIHSISDSPQFGKIIDVIAHYPNGDQITHQFILKEVVPGNWKVADEIFQ